MTETKRLDLSRWTPEGFMISDEMRARTADECSIGPEAVRVRNQRWLYVGCGRLLDEFKTTTMLAVFSADDPDAPIWLATLVRSEYIAPMWEVEIGDASPPPLAEMLRHIVRGSSPARTSARDFVTLDAMAPGWRAGDVVAVVGEE